MQCKLKSNSLKLTTIGLDNGIYKKIKTGEPIFSEAWYRAADEVCYWRKCWNIRRVIMDVVNPTHDDEKFEFKIEASQIDDIIKGIKSLMSKKAWETGESIWEYDEIRYSLKLNIKDLKELKKEMTKNPDLEVIFYDSY